VIVNQPPDKWRYHEQPEGKLQEVFVLFVVQEVRAKHTGKGWKGYAENASNADVTK
jgi:hypothetical protein